MILKALLCSTQILKLWLFNPVCFFLQKIEVIGEDEAEEEDVDDDELVASDLEQMHNLLEFKVRTRADQT